MRFSDIHKYTSCGNWEVHVRLTYLKENIDQWVYTSNLQLNPDFQRGHVWTEEQQIAYVKYVLRGGKNAITLYFNQPGWDGDYKGDFVLVDGLQRLTALLLFLNNGLKAFGHYFNEYEDKPINIDIKLNVNNLKTRKEVLQWYIEFNSSGVVHTKEELDRVRKLLEDEIKKENQNDKNPVRRQST
jgi:uncharacterized protein with ParB-like and HNH nuclease domain